MTLFLQACAAALMTLVLIPVLEKGKGTGSLLAAVVCCMLAGIGLQYLRPVIDFLSTLETLGNLDHEMVRLLLKAAGIGMIAEIAGLVCTDSGNASMGKAVHFMGTAAILWLSLPMLTAFLELVQTVLGGI